MSGSAKIIIFISGVAAGAILAALFAPRPGHEARRLIREKVATVAEEAQFRAQGVRDAIKGEI